jgi:hypothetical protein
MQRKRLIASKIKRFYFFVLLVFYGLLWWTEKWTKNILTKKVDINFEIREKGYIFAQNV